MKTKKSNAESVSNLKKKKISATRTKKTKKKKRLKQKPMLPLDWFEFGFRYGRETMLQLTCEKLNGREADRFDINSPTNKEWARWLQEKLTVCR